jgi:hypothetical protein
MQDFISLYQSISDIGFSGGLMLTIFSLYKGWIVWGRDCTEDKGELKVQRDEYKAIAAKRTAELEARLARLEHVGGGDRP